MNEQVYWIWLSSISGIGNKVFYEILGKFEDLKTAYENYREIPKVVKLNEKMAAALNKSASSYYIDNLINLITKSGVKVLTRLNQLYPKNLIEIENPPPVLYYKGTLPANSVHCCSIVGTRTATKAGIKAATDAAYALSEQGIIIISGMARGIDSCAHRGALNAKGKTIAVLGCGPDIVFPEQNLELYEEIIQSGLIISERLPGTPPKPMFFPARNRIIAGWGDVLITGEGGIKSGAQITVDLALKYGKSVYTLPFNPNSSVSALPIMLVQNGANILKDPLSILKDEGWNIKKTELKKDEEFFAKGIENEIFHLLSREPMHPDEIAAELKIPIKELNLLLTVLEINGIIKSDAGGLFFVN